MKIGKNNVIWEDERGICNYDNGSHKEFKDYFVYKVIKK